MYRAILTLWPCIVEWVEAKLAEDAEAEKVASIKAARAIKRSAYLRGLQRRRSRRAP